MTINRNDLQWIAARVTNAKIHPSMLRHIVNERCFTELSPEEMDTLIHRLKVEEKTIFCGHCEHWRFDVCRYCNLPNPDDEVETDPETELPDSYYAAKEQIKPNRKQRKTYRVDR